MLKLGKALQVAKARGAVCEVTKAHRHIAHMLLYTELERVLITIQTQLHDTLRRTTRGAFMPKTALTRLVMRRASLEGSTHRLSR